MLLQGQKATIVVPMHFRGTRKEDGTTIEKTYNKGDIISSVIYVMNDKDELCSAVNIDGELFLMPYEKLHCHIKFEELSEEEILAWKPNE